MSKVKEMVIIMSDEETREKRRQSYLRNKHAKELKENKAYRIRRVEDKRKRYERLNSNEIISKLDKFIEDNEND
jgi:hypothetical protein